MLHRYLLRFSMFDLTLMAMMAVLGIATKPIITPLVHMITAPLFIPGGALAGGLYMMWIVLARFLVNKNGAATITCLIQAILVMALGVVGSHGVLSLMTYILPGLTVDLGLFLLGQPRKATIFHCFIAGILANLSGTFLVNVVFFRLPLIPLLLSLFLGAFSGGGGGIICFQLLRQLEKTPLFKNVLKPGVFALIIFSIFLTGCSDAGNIKTTIPPLEIKGDVENSYTISFFSGERTSLKEVLEKAEPLGLQEVFLRGENNETVTISSPASGEIFLEIDGENNTWKLGGVAKENRLPGIKEIIVLGDAAPLGIITPAKNLFQMTPGEFLVQNRAEPLIKLEKYFAEYTGPFLAVSLAGEEVFYDNRGQYISFENNSFTLVDQEGKELLENLAGLMFEPPQISIISIVPRIKTLLEDNQSVLLILLDGFGYDQYLYARENGIIPFLGSREGTKMARVAYPPITNVNTASLLTGELPPRTGIHQRRDREPRVQNILDFSIEQGLKVASLQGAINPLYSEFEPILHPGGDEEIIITARDMANEDYDILFIHFKSLDIAGHEYGPFHQRTMETLSILNGYLQELSSTWPGDILIIPDHGMRKTSDGGNHGRFYYQDLIVPFFHLQGGN